MKKQPYLITISGGLGFTYFAVFIAAMRGWDVIWLSMAALVFVGSLVSIFILTYHMWQAIAGEHARMTPRQSILLNFIPGFNVYWLFQCIWGFAKDANVYIERKNIDTPKLNEQVFFWYVVMWLLAPVPYIGWVTVPLAVIFVTMIINTSIDTINAIQTHE